MRHTGCTVALLVIAGCPAPSIPVGQIETETSSPGSTSTTPSDASTTTIDSESTESSQSGQTTETTTSDGVSSSTTHTPVPCEGTDAPQVCFDDPPYDTCVCGGDALLGRNAWVVDLDADGHDDVLAWTFGELDVHPYVTSPSGLVAHASVTLPPSTALHDVFIDPSGAIRVLARRNQTATEVLTYVLDEGFTSAPIGTNLIPDEAFSTQRLGDFDGDGTLDLAVQWEVEDDAAGMGVVFDVLDDPTPATWTDALPISGFAYLGRPCDLDADGADDVFVSLDFDTGVLWGEIGSPTMTVSEPLPWVEGDKQCHDLDGDGDLDIFVPAGCGDCSPEFGRYTVLEQTAPRVFEIVASGGGFDEDDLGGTSALARLFDASERVIVSIGREGALFGDAEMSNFGLRRQLGPFSWDDGLHHGHEYEGLDLEAVIDVDHDGLDELILLTGHSDDPDPNEMELRVYSPE